MASAIGTSSLIWPPRTDPTSRSRVRCQARGPRPKNALREGPAKIGSPNVRCRSTMYAPRPAPTRGPSAPRENTQYGRACSVKVGKVKECPGRSRM